MTVMMNSNCNSTSVQTVQTMCESGVLQHPRYYARQLITPVELTLEHTYLRDKMRRHNRFLHGWGVVCGAQVCLVPNAAGTAAEPWKVSVKPGYILGPYGDEIVIERERVVALNTSGATGIAGDPMSDAPDPWCSDVTVPRTQGCWYVAVKYKEVMARPVKAQPTGCGCNDSGCEYSRLCDGYEIGILNTCPNSHTNPPNLNADGRMTLEDLAQGDLLDCLSCPDEPWVVLACVNLDVYGVIQSIDNCSCRRMVFSLASFWWKCADAAMTITGVQPTSIAVQTTAQDVTLTVTGTNFKGSITADLGGKDVTVKQYGVTVTNDTQLTIAITVAANAAVGPRNLTLTGAGCATATMANAITIAKATNT